MEKQEEYDEINLLDYFNVLKKRKNLILIIIAVSVGITIIYSLLATKIYKARAVIMPSTQRNEQSNMSVIAMQFGISTPSTSNISEIVSLLSSNILMEKVIKRYNLLPVFFDNKESNEVLYPDKIWDGIRFLKDIYKVKYNQKDSTIELSAEFKDPVIAANILNYILTELTDYMSSEAKRVAETNKKYLESQLDKTSDPFIKTKIYNLIAQQIEQAMMAEVRENFAFKVIDPPKAPDKRTKPKRMLMIMMSFVTSLFIGLVAAFFKEYIENARSTIKSQ